MLDIRALMLSTHPTFVAEFESAMDKAGPFRPVPLGPRLAVNGWTVPITLKFESVDDPDAAAEVSPWHAFFAAVYAALDARDGAGTWGDRGVVNRVLDRMAIPIEEASRYVKDTRLRFLWGPGAAVVYNADEVTGLVDETTLGPALARLVDHTTLYVTGFEQGFDPVGLFAEHRWERLRELAWGARVSDADRARIRAAAPNLEVLQTLDDMHALAAARRELRRAARAAEAVRTDIGGVEVSTMGRELRLTGSPEVLDGLKRLPAVVRVLRLSPGELGGEATATALAALDLELLDVSGNRFDAAAATRLPANVIIGVQSGARRIDLNDWDLRHTDPDEAFDMWRVWFARIHGAVQAIADVRQLADAAAWRKLGAAIGPAERHEAPWDEHEAHIRAWLKGAKKLAQPLAKAGGDLQPLWDAVLTLARKTPRDADQPYKGISDTAQAVAMFVGAARVTTATRFGWLEDRAAADRVEQDIRDL